MAEAIGFAEGVIALLGTAAKVIEIIKVLKHGREERAELQHEVDKAYKVMLGMQDQFNSKDFEADPDSPWLVTIKPLFSENGEIENLRKTLISIADKTPVTLNTPLSKIKTLAMWNIDRKDVQQMTDRVHRITTNISLALNQASLTVGVDTHTMAREMNANIKKIQAVVDISQLRKVVEWLSPLDFREQQAHKRGLDETGSWFLQSLAFSGWAEGRSQSLWCHGIPGAGKTIIASKAFSKLCDMYSQPNDLVLIAYCAFDDVNTHTVEGLLAALLRQALEIRKAMDPKVLNLHQRCNSTGANTKPNVEELKDALSAELVHANNIFVLIDGLDEMRAEKQMWDLLNILEGTDPRLRLMVSSRPLFNIKTWFTDAERPHRCSVFPPKLRMRGNHDETESPSDEKSTDEESIDEDSTDEDFTDEDFADEDFADEEFTDGGYSNEDSSDESNIPDLEYRDQDDAWFGCEDCAFSDLDEGKAIVPYQKACYKCRSKSCGRLVCKSCYDSFKICLGCKAEKDQLVYIWPQEVVIEAQPSDLETYVKHRISESMQLERKIQRAEMVGQDLRGAIVTAVVASARQMFLLAKLHMDNIVNLDTAKTILKTLPELPKGTDQIFEQVFDRIGRFANAAQIRRLIKLATYARRPLTTLALEHAIAIESGNTSIDPMDLVDAIDLVNKSLGLLIVDSSNNIRLAHETVGEFMRRDTEQLDYNGDDLFAKICILYLQSQALTAVAAGPSLFQHLESQCLAFPLLPYAAMFWGIHARLGRSISTRDLTLQFLSNEECLAATARIVWYDDLESGSRRDAAEGTSQLHLAAQFGLVDAVTKLLAEGTPINATDSLNTTPLMYAVDNGHEDIVALLLHGQADATVKCKRGQTALHRACLQMDLGMVQQLVEYAGDIAINALDTSRNLTALHWIAGYGEASNIVELLLSREDIDINLLDTTRYRMSALHHSVTSGDSSTVEVLVNDPRIDLNKRSRASATALLIACERDDTDSIAILLDKGADPSIPDEHGGQPMLRAIDYDCVRAVQYLIERGVDHTFKDFLGRGVLHACAVNRRPHIMRYLLQTKEDLDPNIQGDRGETPLHDAVGQESPNVVRTLLSFGARTDIRDNTGRSPLRVAQEHKHTGILALLTEARRRERTSNEAQHTNNDQSCDERTMKLLESHAAIRVDTLDANYELPIHAMVRLYKADELREYLERLGEQRKVILDSLDNDNKQTPLHVAVDECTPEVVDILLHFGADPNITNLYGLTPLHLAACSCHREITESLLKYNVDINVLDNMDRTALDIALSTFQYRSDYHTPYLIVKKNPRISDDQKAQLAWILQYAVELNDLETIKILCSHGVPCHLRVGSKFTPYQTAKKKGFTEVAEFLLEELHRRQAGVDDAAETASNSSMADDAGTRTPRPALDTQTVSTVLQSPMASTEVAARPEAAAHAENPISEPIDRSDGTSVKENLRTERPTSPSGLLHHCLPSGLTGRECFLVLVIMALLLYHHQSVFL